MSRLLLSLLSLVIGFACVAQAPPCPTESAISIARGTFEAKAAPQCYERTTLVSRAEIFVSSESLTRVFADKLQASHSKIRDLTVKHDAEGATLTGSITKILPMHFSIKGPVSTDGNSIRLHAKSVKADGLPIKDLLKLVGAELNSLIPVKGMKGIEIGEDYLSFSPQEVADLEGHIASVRTSDAGLTIRYTPMPHGASNRAKAR